SLAIFRSDLKSDEGLHKLHYAVSSVEVDPLTVNPATAVIGQTDLRYSQIPEGFPTELVTFTHSLLDPVDAPMEKAVALQNFFRSGAFTYDKMTPPQEMGGNYTGMSDFVLRNRRGYCTWFATAMASMARVEAIPSRVVVGWAGGTEVSPGIYEMTTEDSHAWVELYFADYGWLRFEPTPGGPNVAPPAYAMAQAAPTRTPTPTATPTPTPSSLTSTATTPTPTTPTVVPATRHLSLRWLLIPAALLVLILLCFVPQLIRNIRRHHWLSPAGSPAERALGAWSEIHDTVIDLGLPWPKDTSRIIAETLRPRVGPTEYAGLVEIALLVEQARFARHLDTVPDNLVETTKAITTSMLHYASSSAKSKATWRPASNWAALRRRFSRSEQAHQVPARRKA
ncbi:MAG: transglutaminase-like domain-containing protein, partial [Propionibacteriaceae bacterium]